jgi:mannose-1-phosphate guanylyltransferase
MIWAVLMAGGAGTRFWPLSRSTRPKQFLPIVGQKTMIEETVRRILPLIPRERILIVTRSKQKAALARLVKSIPSRNILAEPCPRNTAPCLALAALHLLRRDPAAVFAALPADHSIENGALFRKHLRFAAGLAASDRHVVFGIPPAGPHTGFGYIACGKRLSGPPGTEVYQVRRFVEKPSFSRAAAYLAAGNYFWNSGMFVWKASFFTRSLETALPRMKPGLAAIRKSLGTPAESGVLARVFPAFPSISIDYGLMEKARNMVLVKAGFDWSDVGSWSELGEIWKKDGRGNAIRGTAVVLGGGGNVVHAGKRLVALVGVRDHIVVDAGDAVLVAPKEKSQNVKQLVEELKGKGFRRYL